MSLDAEMVGIVFVAEGGDSDSLWKPLTIPREFSRVCDGVCAVGATPVGELVSPTILTVAILRLGLVRVLAGAVAVEAWPMVI